MSQLATISPKPPLAIRSAVERGWAAFSHCPWVLMGFTLLSGGANLAAQLLYRYESSLVLSLLGKPDPVAIALAAAAWIIYALTGLWLVVGLMRGAQLALNQRRPRLAALIRVDGRAMLRCFGTVMLVLVLLALIVRLAQASSWMLTLIQPLLAPLPLVAGLAALGGSGLLAAVQLLLGWCLWRCCIAPQRRRWLVVTTAAVLLSHGAGAAALAAMPLRGEGGSERVLVLQPAIPTRRKFQWDQQQRLQERLRLLEQPGQ